jgi:hypothetical protein
VFQWNKGVKSDKRNPYTRFAFSGPGEVTRQKLRACTDVEVDKGYILFVIGISLGVCWESSVRKMIAVSCDVSESVGSETKGLLVRMSVTILCRSNSNAPSDSQSRDHGKYIE